MGVPWKDVFTEESDSLKYIYILPSGFERVHFYLTSNLVSPLLLQLLIPQIYNIDVHILHQIYKRFEIVERSFGF